MSKPIRVFYSELSGRFYASNQYQENDSRVIITGEKFDVTNEIEAAIVKHDLVFSEATPSTTEDE